MIKTFYEFIAVTLILIALPFIGVGLMGFVLILTGVRIIEATRSDNESV